MNHEQILAAYVSSFIDELVLSGISDAVVSPGSRSTPLAIAIADHPGINVYMNIDERSAAFFALGLAKARKKAVALLCTSGSATANYHPAIVEAFYSRVPLIVLTADRPVELHDVGAPQTIDQHGMYGAHVRKFFEVTIPEQDANRIAHTRLIAARAAAIATDTPEGPVHVNFPLRSPLVPDPDTMQRFRHAAKPLVSVTKGRRSLTDEDRDALAEKFGRTAKGVIVCGPLRAMDQRDRKALVAFAERLGYPVIADPLSQLRRGSHSMKNIVDCYDTFLKSTETASALQPELIVRFGAMPVSKSLAGWLRAQKTEQMVVDDGSGWRDPAQTAQKMIYCDESLFCREISGRIGQVKTAGSASGWLSLWRRINEETKRVLTKVKDQIELSEEKAFLLLAERMPDRSRLFAGNSMPVRELDTFFFTGSRQVAVDANRGANGIDGVVSTAVGESLACEKTVLAIGDLSFFHDMNGLLAARQHGADLTIVLINNDGGGIFSFLPQAREKHRFETLFGTPHGLDFSHAAKLYGAAYTRIANWDDYRSALTRAFARPGLKIIEVPTKRGENVDSHRALQAQVSDQIKSIPDVMEQ